MRSKEIPVPGRSKSGKTDSPRFASVTGKAAVLNKEAKPGKAPAPARSAHSTAFAVISRRAADRLGAGHVWVYRSDVEQLAPAKDGSPLVTVFDPRGRLLGTALHSPSSQIALRRVSGDAIDYLRWIELFRERLHAAIEFREPILNKGSHGEARTTDACRLVFSEADFLPGLIIDKYGDLAIFQVLTKGMDDAALRSVLREVLIAKLDPRAIFERADIRIQELEQFETAIGGSFYLNPAGSDQSSSTIFHLNGLRFRYETGAGQKTGAFLDQRENYVAAARHCRGEALDVCTYQGGFALHLARFCSRVTGVDASRSALEVAEQNLDLNRDTLGRAEVDWIEANAFDLLREQSDTGTKFDAIVLDPPAFAKSRKTLEGALRGYKELNLRALKMLRPGGTLVTCSCSHHVSSEDFAGVVAAAAADARRQVRVLERHGASSDHPVLLTVPETEYLKCLICRVD
jgi:23S rRNA (cytosine1962-C5)-methyltransferase